ncbi:hypothetical protein [Hymenobacter qilianensis]|uniref:hypothetical protein n=1 Tax=Hymenobacter qilianensis TaxID=1385715 RepID=UPI001CB9CD25|nr:hypothetical protein [Hymenobacter qilianensis]
MVATGGKFTSLIITARATEAAFVSVAPFVAAFPTLVVADSVSVLGAFLKSKGRAGRIGRSGPDSSVRESRRVSGSYGALAGVGLSVSKGLTLLNFRLRSPAPPRGTAGLPSCRYGWPGQLAFG